MRHFFRRKSSCQVAKDRLKILLISDRVNCSPEMMELIKNDIARVISKYMKIDSDNMEIQINAKSGKNGRNAKPSLYANIPIVDVTVQDLAANR
ncbi:MAG: cell division topological specificity factor MinE [Acetatifactor sp.]